ncbi:hypothetical protein GHK48_13200 [Sinorhizobium fredii]|uniref:Uncharacterized protein n=1 Tax=Rhizobium fredii TaxID=380 RepID=A0A844AC30_RHIFR|nr:hypothetical protein [Sinorhizobium fredii]MQX09206.1 hypothetical protein [Sinorhizobium fredii]UTY50089.1 hypothetical protein EPK84_26675 [Sinorhizobium fredii]
MLVTGIQSAQVLGLQSLFRAADAALLDPCDKHRDEGESAFRQAQSRYCRVVGSDALRTLSHFESLHRCDGRMLRSCGPHVYGDEPLPRCSSSHRFRATALLWLSSRAA